MRPGTPFAPPPHRRAGTCCAPTPWRAPPSDSPGVGFGLPRGVVDPEIVALLEEALRLLGDRRDALWARVAVRLAVETALLRRGRALRHAQPGRRSRRRRRAGDDATLAYVLNARHFAVWGTADVDERLALVDEAVRLAERLGEPDLNLQGRTWRLLDLAEIGDGTAFDRELETSTSA